MNFDSGRNSGSGMLSRPATRMPRPNFTDQHLVINGTSDLLHKIYGKDGDGYHARSALGFAALPTGAAVEVEAIFEIKG